MKLKPQELYQESQYNDYIKEFMEDLHVLRVVEQTQNYEALTYHKRTKFLAISPNYLMNSCNFLFSPLELYPNFLTIKEWMETDHNHFRLLF